ncbi:MAG TPA: malate/lactate/ureidoglycolate dehydrogenase [Acetobacteraceae bacterium]|nr:malate/lactate/ureidoglycolate dehydrogenase [Acetobacteraceae bacterium]
MDQPLTTRTVPVDTLTMLVTRIFSTAGCTPAEAKGISESLVRANLAGHDSHGVVRVPRYVENLRLGQVRAGQSLTIVSETPGQALVDGNFGFGQTVAPLAVDLGIAKARANGVSVIGLRNSGHAGRIGEWAERAAAAGLISIHFVNVFNGELVAPFGGVDRRFSTNPFCIGIPVPEGLPLILDFATSVVAEGKVLVAANGGKPVPADAMITPDGKLSADPATLYGPLEGTYERNPSAGAGALRAFGEHKGSGLAFMCEILAGCLTDGGTSGPAEKGPGRRIANGMLSIYLAPSGFGAPRFAQAILDYVAYVKSARPAVAGGEVLIPGEPEQRVRAARLAGGIPLQLRTWEAIVATARVLGLDDAIPSP